MTQAHHADDWTGEFDVDYIGPKNIVIRCPDCGHEMGASVTTGTIGPHRSVFAHCPECRSHKAHYPIREADRGEYDGDHICGECDTLYDNTMDADMCCSDSHEANADAIIEA